MEQKEVSKASQQAMKEEEKTELLRMSEISLWLDTYDDIFSDFDSRPYSQRAVSQDFLAEAKRASRDMVSGEIELKFLIPADKRNPVQEHLIKKRLIDHFTRHFEMLRKERDEVVKQGLRFVVIGIILMFWATYILFKFEKIFLTSFMVILLEPGGWFLFWEGLNKILFESKTKKPEYEFYHKMTKCEVTFTQY